MSLTTSHNDAPIRLLLKTVARRFGKVTDEFAALRSTCGVYELPQRAKIRLTGSDRVRWLNGMVTNNIRDLAANHGVYAFLAEPARAHSGRLDRLSTGAIACWWTPDQAQVGEDSGHLRPLHHHG